jgi:histidinol phosphatase-like enzyme
MINKEIIIWDNDGTIMGSQNPHDTTDKAKVILPNVQQVMNASNAVHVICSGCKTPESELQNFDPGNVIKRFTALMEQLPIQVAVFSPAIGGTECYVVIKKIGSEEITVQKAHEDTRYQHLIGQFKKPGIGMLEVIRDILDAEFGLTLHADNAVMVGDTWHDEHAASAIGIEFIDADDIHTMRKF